MWKTGITGTSGFFHRWFDHGLQELPFLSGVHSNMKFSQTTYGCFVNWWEEKENTYEKHLFILQHLFLVLHMWKQMMRTQHHLRPTVSGVGAARGAVRDAGDGEEGGMKEEVQDGSLLSTGAEVAAVWHISPFLRGRHSAHTPLPLPSLL